MENQDYSFGWWLQRRRHACNFTQQQLARLAGCSTSMIRKIEADERRPSPDIIELLVTALQVPAADQAAFRRLARGI